MSANSELVRELSIEPEGETKNQRRERLKRMRMARKADEIDAKRDGAAATLQLVEGNMRRAALLSGLSLDDFRAAFPDLGETSDTAPRTTDADGETREILALYRRYLEGLMVISIQKAVRTPFKELQIGIGITSDKINNVHRSRADMAAAVRGVFATPPKKKGLNIPNQVTEPLPVQPEAPKTPEKKPSRTVQFREQSKVWEQVLAGIMKDATDANQEMTRNEAIAQLCKQKPEAAPYLPLSPTPDKEVEQENERIN